MKAILYLLFFFVGLFLTQTAWGQFDPQYEFMAMKYPISRISEFYIYPKDKDGRDTMLKYQAFFDKSGRRTKEEKDFINNKPETVVSYTYTYSNLRKAAVTETDLGRVLSAETYALLITTDYQYDTVSLKPSKIIESFADTSKRITTCTYNGSLLQHVTCYRTFPFEEARLLYEIWVRYDYYR